MVFENAETYTGGKGYFLENSTIGTEEDEREDIRLYGCPFTEAMEKPFESPEHVEGFPPCAIFVLAGDELLGHSKLLADALEKLHIPCRLEIGPEDGHGFADGTGTCIAGWTKRAVRWYEEQIRAFAGRGRRHDT